jgi:hypothetical protein
VRSCPVGINIKEILKSVIIKMTNNKQKEIDG